MNGFPGVSKLALLPALLAIFVVAAHAQESDVKRYTVDARLDAAQKAADVRTTFTLANLSDAPKRQLQFRVNGAALVRSVTVGGKTADFTSRDDTRYKGLKVVNVQLPSAIPMRATADVVVDTRLTLESGAPDATIAADETVLLPSSVWVPVVNTQFTQYGLNTAPYAITIATGAGERAVSGGTASGGAFNQPLHGLPFVITGDFAAPITRDANGITLEAWVPEGAPAAVREGANKLLDEAAKIAAFYGRAIGPAPQATFRIIASDRAAGFSDVSGVALSRRAFANRYLDAETYELIADGLARVWIEGPAPVRGAAPGQKNARASGVGFVADSLPRYLAILASGERFGDAAEAAAFGRLSLALANMGSLAQSVQLALATPFDPAYGGLMRAKGPLVLRLVEREIGRDKMLAGLGQALAAARQKGALTLSDLRDAWAKASGRDLSALFTNWVDTVVDPDLIIGVPQQSGAAWTSALRNLGTGDVTVDVVATTESGKKLTERVTIPSEGFAEVRFATTEQIASVEIDPEKIVPQRDFSNDARPQRPATSTLFTEGIALVKRGEFGPAEAKLREVVAAEPANAEAKAWLARALFGLGRQADAERIAREALATEPIPLDAVAWANYVLGQTATAANRAADAVGFYAAAAEAAVEVSALKAAREGLIAAERAAGRAAQPEPSIAKFFADFDRAVTAGVNTAQATQYVDEALLPDFVRGLVTGLERKWTTAVLRTEMLEGDEALVDARFDVAATSGSTSATVLVRLRKSGDRWKIVDIQALETT